MKLPLLVGYSLVLFLSAASASQFTTVGLASAEEYFERSQQSAEKLQELVDEVLEMERTQGELDGEVLKLYSADSKALIENTRYNLQMAAQGGHPVAPYLLANLLSAEMISDPERQKSRDGEVCRLYQASADKNLLAGAVAIFNKCNEPLRRFQFEGPAMQKMFRDLKKALETKDQNKDYYPLPVKQSICFRDDKIPDFVAKNFFAKAMEVIAPTMLTYDQFKADAYYTLAMVSDGSNRSALLEKIEQVKIAKALGCNDKFDLQRAFEMQLSKKPK